MSDCLGTRDMSGVHLQHPLLQSGSRVRKMKLSASRCSPSHIGFITAGGICYWSWRDGVQGCVVLMALRAQYKTVLYSVDVLIAQIKVQFLLDKHQVIHLHCLFITKVSNMVVR